MDNINVLQAMQSLDFMLEDIEDKEIRKWVNNELNGYKKDKDIPNYRNANAILIGNVQVGYSLYKNINIPLSDLKAIEMFTKIKIREPISTIMQMAKAEKWTSNSKWLTLTDLMLAYRCQSFFCRLYVPEAMNGIYTCEEVEEVSAQRQQPTDIL